MTVPTNYWGEYNFIVWENLHDFLELWIKFWYFWLEQLCFDYEDTIEKIESWKYYDFEYSWNSEILEKFSQKYNLKEWGKWSIGRRLTDLKSKYYDYLKINNK